MAQEEITFTFDTVYVVRKAREDIDLMPLRAYLSSIGDSLVIGEDDETFKVHVHTDIPGVALTESQKYGTLELAKIENMRSQADALPDGRPRVPTIWTPLRKRWKTARTATRSPPPKKPWGSLPSVPETALPPCSGIWAATPWFPAGRL